MSQLPPPPPLGSFPPQPSAPWAQTPAIGPTVPPWRTGRIGWVILNIVIGLGIGLGVFVAVWVGIGAGHFDLQALNRALQANRNVNYLSPEMQRILAAIGGSFLVALAAGVLGWLLFVYLRIRTAVRVAFLVAIALFAILIGYAMLASTLPKLPGY